MSIMRKKWRVAAFGPDGTEMGDTCRTFRTLWAAKREQAVMAAYVPRMVPVITDGKPVRTKPLVRLMTWRVVPAAKGT